jgi:hypothetical protein
LQNLRCEPGDDQRGCAVGRREWDGRVVVYLAAQIHQNTRSIRAMMVDSLAHPIADVIRPMAEDRELLMRAFHVVVEDWHGATEDDRMRALPLFFSTFKLFENAWFQQRQGALDPQQWQGWDAYIRMYYHRPM